MVRNGEEKSNYSTRQSDRGRLNPAKSFELIPRNLLFSIDLCTLYVYVFFFFFWGGGGATDTRFPYRELNSLGLSNMVEEEVIKD